MAGSGGTTEETSIVRISAGSDRREAGTNVLRAARETAAEVRVVGVGPTGVTALSPLVLATHDGETAFFPCCDARSAKEVVEALDDGTFPRDDASAVVEHESETTTLPRPADGPLAVGTRRVLDGSGWRVPADVADHRAAGGVLSERVPEDPEQARERLAAATLRGRGRGDGAPDSAVAEQWTTVEESDGDAVVVVNANDADEHASADRLLLESAPLSVLDPALAAARLLDATDVVVYTNDDEPLARRRAREAADVLTESVETGVSIHVLAGPDRYIAGEMTMALEAMEGNDRLEARIRPPDPSEHGLYGRPTLVHTPRTFVQVGRVLAGEDLDGAAADPGTRLVTVVGDDAPATVELATDTALEDALEAVPFEGRIAMASVGGRFGGLTRSLDVPASASALRGARLGTNGVVELFDDSTCPVALAGERAKFAREANCGRCVPCREGSKQLVSLLREVYDGEYQDGMLRELTRVMGDTSLCAFGRDAARPVTTAMDEFEPEFRAHANGRCPSDTCMQS